jgi:hypothetical protein
MDQIANRKRKGARGGRPVDFDSEAYKGRSVDEQSFNIFKQWRSSATRYDCERGFTPFREAV